MPLAWSSSPHCVCVGSSAYPFFPFFVFVFDVCNVVFAFVRSSDWDSPSGLTPFREIRIDAKPANSPRPVADRTPTGEPFGVGVMAVEASTSMPLSGILATEED